MRYTQNQIDTAYDQKEVLPDMKRHLDALIDLAAKNDMPDLGMMAQDLASDVQTRLDEIDEIIHWDHCRQAEEELREYMAAV